MWFRKKYFVVYLMTDSNKVIDKDCFCFRRKIDAEKKKEELINELRNHGGNSFAYIYKKENNCKYITYHDIRFTCWIDVL
jgi:hypothetical protein